MSLSSVGGHAQGQLLTQLFDACERSLVAEHPYQIGLRKLSMPELVWEYRRWGGFRQWTCRSTDEFHMAFAIMVGRYNQGGLSVAEQAMVREALEDYPYWL